MVITMIELIISDETYYSREYLSNQLEIFYFDDNINVNYCKKVNELIDNDFGFVNYPWLTHFRFTKLALFWFWKKK